MHAVHGVVEGQERELEALDRTGLVDRELRAVLRGQAARRVGA